MSKTPDTPAQRAARWRAKHPDRYRAAKRKYYASEKGKACKRAEDARRRASGAAAAVDRRRGGANKSEARRIAHNAYQVARRASEKAGDEFDRLVVSEAAALARLRTRLLGAAWHVDHVVPVSKGGSASAYNLQVVPAAWNRRKSNKHTDRFFNL